MPRQAPAVRRSAGPPAIRFEGPPTSLTGLVGVPGSQRRALTVDVALPGRDSAEQVRALTAPVGHTHTRVRLVLPPGTAPGAYAATVHAPDDDIPAVALVLERPHLTMTPGILRLAVPPGGRAEPQLMVVNTGNTPCEIARAYAFGLFESEGLDRAVGAGLLAGTNGQERLAAVMDSLAGSHGGLVRVTVSQGAGILAPGEARQLAAALSFSDRLKPGVEYFATWRVHNLRIPVRVQAAGPPVTTKEPQ